MKTKGKSLVLFCLWFSLIFHGLLANFIYWLPKTSNLDKVPPSPLIIKVIDNKKKNPLDLEQDHLRQIVEQRKDLSYVQDKASKNAKFLSQYHQKVTKQTAAKKQISTNQDFLANKPERQIAQETLGQKEAVTSKTLSDFMPKMDWNKYMLAARTNNQPAMLREDLVRLANKVNPGFQSNDYLKNVKEGKETLLNTRAFKFYTYYRRIKEQVQASWKPMIRAKINDLLLRGESLLAIEQKTSLLITIDRFGDLINIQVLKKSQISILDHIAIKSFENTAPFPHPPKSLIGEDGYLQIHWDFILEKTV